ncbi:Calnexin-like 1 [Porphyridium purpureum]|uniref:Calnexin-like 1 n=1 Tax=Porphyridium purpureum TaxID=35688 RepID=A0A5J4YR27_PORPP|nr:Calnexin-like 1 [Porphyridium purpureum]|eukprot:POR3451..scf229_5
MVRNRMVAALLCALGVVVLVGVVSAQQDDEQIAGGANPLEGMDDEELARLMEAYGGGGFGGMGENYEDEDPYGGLGAGGFGDMPPPGPELDDLVIDSGVDSEAYSPPDAPASALFLETFQRNAFDEDRWVYSSKAQYNGRFVLGGGRAPGIHGDKGAMLSEKARFYGAVAMLPEPVVVAHGDKLVFQYEVKFDSGLTCSGAYMKLPKSPFATPDVFDNSVQYSIMFGPDKCGDTAKVHVIIQSEHPTTGKLTEHHLTNPPAPFIFGSETHLYTLVLDVAAQTYEVRVDGDVKKAGSLAHDFEPPFQPPSTIPDAKDTKPADWEDEPRIPDPSATKPADWDEDAPLFIPDESATKPDDWLEDEEPQIPDPSAVKPDEWEDSEDGAWQAPLIENPKCVDNGCGPWVAPQIANPDYKGKWTAPMIDNPKYVGPWAPREIENPDYYKVEQVTLLPIAALAFEIWAMDYGIIFDNVYLGTSVEDAEAFANATTVVKRAAETKKSEHTAKKDASDVNSKIKNQVLDAADAVANALEVVLSPIDALLRKHGLDVYVDAALDFVGSHPLIPSVGIPLVLVVFFLVLTAHRKKQTRSSRTTAVPDVSAKKTDAPQADDAAAPAPSAEQSEITPEPKPAAAATRRRKAEH